MAKKGYVRKTTEEVEAEINRYSTQAIKDMESFVTRPEDVLELSEFMSHFYHYSANNMAMIHSQFRGAYAVGSFKTFSDAGFRINKGEKAIKVWVPVEVTTFLSEGKVKTISKATLEEKAKIKRGEIETKKIRRYKLGNVFDISQTNANLADLPNIFPNRHYDFKAPESGKQLYAALKGIGEKLQAPLLEDAFRQIGTAKGAFVQDSCGQLILMNPKNSLAENIATGIHELTHAQLHGKDKKRERTLSRSEEEFQAELTSHIVSKHFGLDTAEKAIPYIATWTKNGSTLEEKTMLLKEIHETARSMIGSIHEEMDRLQDRSVSKEHGWEKESEGPVVHITSKAKSGPSNSTNALEQGR